MKPTELLTNVTPKQIEDSLSRSFQTEPVEASVNGFLINTGSKLVLVDTGRLFFRADARQAGCQPPGVGLPAGAGGRNLHHAHASGSLG
jgi:hypothetical protein